MANDENVKSILTLVGNPSELTEADLKFIFDRHKSKFAVEDFEAARIKLLPQLMPSPASAHAPLQFGCPHCGKPINLVLSGGTSAK